MPAYRPTSRAARYTAPPLQAALASQVQSTRHAARVLSALRLPTGPTGPAPGSAPRCTSYRKTSDPFSMRSRVHSPGDASGEVQLARCSCSHAGGTPLVAVARAVARAVAPAEARRRRRRSRLRLFDGGARSTAKACGQPKGTDRRRCRRGKGVHKGRLVASVGVRHEGGPVRASSCRRGAHHHMQARCDVGALMRALQRCLPRRRQRREALPR